MNVSGILRTVALCCLAVGVHGPSAIHCSHGEELISSRKPSSMKEVLDLVGKLNSAGSFMNEVLEKLHDVIKVYCDETYINRFYQNNDSIYRGYIYDVIRHVSAIRNTITTTDIKDGRHADLQVSNLDSNLYANALAESIPQLYSALYFLYFNGSALCIRLDGGKWGKFQCNKKENNLGMWLTDEIDKIDEIDESKVTEIMPRGFKSPEELTSRTGIDVAVHVEQAVNHTSGGSLQNALYGMLFLGPWHHAKTGHGLLFYYQFCLGVVEDSFINIELIEPVDLTTLKAICKELADGLGPFIEQTAYISRIYAVSSNPTEKYETVIRKDAFYDYVYWLRDNLVPLQGSLAHMIYDSQYWTRDNINNATSAGPLKYGFVFKDGTWGGTEFMAMLGNPVEVVHSATESLLEIFPRLKHIYIPEDIVWIPHVPVPPTNMLDTPQSLREEPSSATVIPSMLSLLVLFLLV